MKTMKTKYYGIYIEATEDGFWLSSDNGCELYVGKMPTDDDIESFVAMCM